jgi:hypothetical protein
MRSGVAASNDNLIGDFRDERTAYLVGDLLWALDRNDHPEYRGFDVKQLGSPFNATATATDPWVDV